MKERKTLMMLLVIGVIGSVFLLTNIISMSALAQGHAGHTAQPPAAVEKPKEVKPQVKPQAAQEEAVEEEAPQVEISPEQQQLIGVKTVKVAMKPLQKVIRTVGQD